MTLATSSQNQVWAAPLFYIWDGDKTLYFVSHNESRHVNHLMQNPQVAVSIFDSHQKEGVANGLQLEGYAVALDPIEYSKVLALHFDQPRIEHKIREYHEKNRGIFKIQIKEMYMQDTEYFKANRIDKRILI